MNLEKSPSVRGLALATTQYTSFDRQYSCSTSAQRPDRYRLIEALDDDMPRIARGSGVSYVAASFGQECTVQEMAAFNRFLAFDSERGLLKVEAGVRIADVLRFTLKHGWYLPVVPGHPAASVGGCIAADVHGKNPARDRTFHAWLQNIEIYHPARGTVSADSDVNTELFEASCGGFGLTGTILNATLRLVPAPSGMAIERIPVKNLGEAAWVLKKHTNVEMLYGWHNGLVSGGSFGRGVIWVGRPYDVLPIVSSTRARDLPSQLKIWPWRCWNHATLKAANTWLETRWRRADKITRSLAATFFPLNDSGPYFSAFGPAGLVEVQWLIPHATFFTFYEELEYLSSRLKPLIALMSSKLFVGNATGLGFAGEGIALSLQLAAPQKQHAFLEALTDLAIRHGGRPNLIKDSTLTASIVKQTIPNFTVLRTRLKQQNPGEVYCSELSRRLAL